MRSASEPLAKKHASEHLVREDIYAEELMLNFGHQQLIN